MIVVVVGYSILSPKGYMASGFHSKQIREIPDSACLSDDFGLQITIRYDDYLAERENLQSH